MITLFSIENEISAYIFLGLIVVSNGLANVLGSSTWAEINGVMYAPVVAEDEEEMGDEEEPMDDDADLDLEAVIKELESELDEVEDLGEPNPRDSS